MKLEGLSAVPPFECFVLQPLPYPEACDEHHDNETTSGHIKIRVDLSLDDDEIHSPNVIGGFTRYLGSTTQENTGGVRERTGKELPFYCKQTSSSD